MKQTEKNLFGIEKLNVKRSEIPAVTHVDYSARIQTVDGKNNPNYFKLLTKFKKLSKRKKESFSKKSKYVLGTVQLGKKYFNNESITQQRANKILNHATKNEINFLDTAHDYWKAEKSIGNFCYSKKKPF